MTFLQKCALSPQAGHLHIYWLGQAGFLIRNSSGKNLLIDAYLSDYVEKCDGSKRLMMAVAEPQDLRPDVILASHDHADHLDMDSLPLLLSHGAPLFCSGESYRRCAQAGFPMQQITAMKPGDRASAAGYSIEAVFADHGDYAPDAVGFWIESEGVRLYFTGDTSYQPGRMAPVAQRHPDLLILPINGEFGNMNERDAAMLAAQTNAGLTIPCHFWTFAHHHGDPGLFQDAMLRLAPQNKFYILCQGEMLAWPPAEKTRS
jgi:L-ascorbate 6-phosphate lactonase